MPQEARVKSPEETQEFLIFTPHDAVYGDHQVLASLKQHLSEQMPELKFVIAFEWSIGSGHGFLILPVVKTEHGPGSLEIVASTERTGPIPEIQAALETFDPRGRARTMH